MGLSNPLHIAVLGLIILLIFGARRLPELGRSLGSGIKEFKGSLESSHEAPAPGLEKPAPAGELR